MLKRLSSALILAVALYTPAHGELVGNSSGNTTASVSTGTYQWFTAATPATAPATASQTSAGLVASTSANTYTPTDSVVSQVYGLMYGSNNATNPVSDETLKAKIKTDLGIDTQPLLRVEPKAVAMGAANKGKVALLSYPFTINSANKQGKALLDVAKNVAGVTASKFTLDSAGKIVKKGDYIVTYADKDGVSVDTFITDKAAANSSKELNDGTIFFSTKANVVMKASSAFQDGTDYVMWVAIKDNGKFDLDSGDGNVFDPATLLPAASDDDDGDSGCVFNPAAGLSLDLVLLGLGGVAFGLSRRFRK